MKKYIDKIQKRFQNIGKRFQGAFRLLINNDPYHFNQYVESAPHSQNAINIFKGEWSSRFPDSYHLEAGTSKLFEDTKIQWAIQEFGGVGGKKVLELGPLEGGHSYLLEKNGAASVTAIEANPRGFLKCLISKEILQLKQTRFLCGDFIQYLKESPETFDACIASGVLYHMRNPVELISLISKKCSQVFIWTHYYDQKICSKDLILKTKFTQHEARSFEGFSYTQHTYQYGFARSLNSFCGGPNKTTNWLSREDILSACKHYGFKKIQVKYEQNDHQNGPCFAFVASKE